jgi:carboxylate-amine ligase
MAPSGPGYGASMAVRKVGVEEELFLVDPKTRLLTGMSGSAVAAHADPVEVTQELFLQQLETSTEPCTTGPELLEALRAGRRAIGEAAAATGARAVAAGTHPLAHDSADFTPQSRYAQIEDLGGETARQSMMCGMHVHVDICDRDEGVAVIDRLRPWLPVLLAVSANSPYCLDRDTAYASWRSQLISRWPTAGPSEAFGSADGYRQVADRMQAWGAALDPGMLYFDARLAQRYPTVEVRVADVCTDLEDALLVALLTRALVATSADPEKSDGDPIVACWRSDLLRVATWRAARFGTSGQVVHPRTAELAPARTVLNDTVEHVSGALEEAGDLDEVKRLVDRLLTQGSGATRQRRVYERSGDLATVVDDLAGRTEQSWMADST